MDAASARSNYGEVTLRVRDVVHSSARPAGATRASSALEPCPRCAAPGRAGRRGVALGVAVLLVELAGSTLGAQPTRIGVVEVYGAQSVKPDDVRRAAGITAGDAVAADSVIEQRVRQLRGVADADVSVVCCESGRSVVYIGIQEGTARFALRPDPTGFVAMPDEVVEAEVEFGAALQQAVTDGRTEEDHSAGHALMRDPRARAVQQRFIDLAMLHADTLRSVLRESRFPLQRALAAQVLGYLPDKRAAVEALVPALTDPSSAVRNDAARALWIIASYAHDKPALRAAIPPEPLIAMLHSVHWTDRNKASLVMMALTASRDPSLLGTLNAGARAALEEMARWRTQHALAPHVILGRMDGEPDDQIFAAWQARNAAR